MKGVWFYSKSNQMFTVISVIGVCHVIGESCFEGVGS